MIKMFVTGIGIEQTTGQPIVMLNDDQKVKVLPILIGVTEAKSISRALTAARSKRPSTHELLSDMIADRIYEGADAFWFLDPIPPEYL